MAKRRRAWLAAAASAVGSALAGCMDGNGSNGGDDNRSNRNLSDGTGDPEIPPTVVAAFPQFQYDAGNTGAVADVSGPTGAITSLFEFGGTDRRLGSPAVADGTVFVTGTTGDDGEPTATAGTEATTGTGSGTVVSAVDAVAGTVQWEQSYAATGDPGPTAVVDGTVLAPVGGSVVALDAASGDQQWSYAGGLASGITVADGTVYVIGTQDGVAKLSALSAADGTVSWEADVAAETNHTTPAVADGTVYVGGTALQAFGAADGREQWRVETPVSTPPVVREDSVVVGSESELAVYDTGGDERWSVDLGTDDESVPVTRPPAVADDRLYLSVADGIRSYDLANGEEQYAVTIGIDGTPVVADGYVYLLGPGQVTCLAADDGATEWSYGTRQHTVTDGVAPAVVDGVAYFPVERLYAIAE